MKPNSKDQFTIVPFKKLASSKAWKVTSELVRRKSKGICYTCKRHYPLERLNAGHFIEKIGNAGTYFDLDGLRAQCFTCNRKLHGAKDIFALNLIKELGPNIIEDLHKRARKARVWTKQDLNDIVKSREKELESLI